MGYVLLVAVSEQTLESDPGLPVKRNHHVVISNALGKARNKWPKTVAESGSFWIWEQLTSK